MRNMYSGYWVPFGSEFLVVISDKDGHPKAGDWVRVVAKSGRTTEVQLSEMVGRPVNEAVYGQNYGRPRWRVLSKEESEKRFQQELAQRIAPRRAVPPVVRRRTSRTDAVDGPMEVVMQPIVYGNEPPPHDDADMPAERHDVHVQQFLASVKR